MPPNWPQRHSGNKFVPVARAFAEIGAGLHGTVQVVADAAGHPGFAYTVAVVAGVGLSVPLSADLVGHAITVTLGTDGAGALDPTKNTATLVAAAVDALPGVSAGLPPFSTGADPLTGAEGPTTCHWPENLITFDLPGEDPHEAGALWCDVGGFVRQSAG